VLLTLGRSDDRVYIAVERYISLYPSAVEGRPDDQLQLGTCPD
jgi:hypothetical protein